MKIDEAGYEDDKKCIRLVDLLFDVANFEVPNL